VSGVAVERFDELVSGFGPSVPRKSFVDAVPETDMIFAASFQHQADVAAVVARHESMRPMSRILHTALICSISKCLL